ncbi:MAG: oxygen-insensitive NAD(P)H nitroreductase [Gammaproteobacteria bacterium]|nr:oxygen-insensitive NAD(P)H nitroreductase [Gammaproteobacteria bacterium]
MESAELTRIATTRHTCKAFDPTRKIAAADLAALRTVLRYAPSSINSQPWHFVIAESDAAKVRLTGATEGNFAYNTPKLRHCSHALVLCVKRDFDAAHIAAILEQEDRDGRFPTPEAKANQNNSRNYYVTLHRDELRDSAAWMQRQLYIALGMLLQGAAVLGIDACPIEGFDSEKLDTELNLAEKNLTAVVLVALGYRSADDFNAKLPKSRLAAGDLFTVL